MILKEDLVRLTDKMSEQTKRAFLAAIRDMRDSVNMARLERALAAGDVAAALDALNLSPGFMEPVRVALSQAFLAGGASVIGGLPSRGLSFAVRFDGRNPRAEEWARSQSSALIVDILESTREAAREIVRAGIERGANPRKTALELAGRIDKVSGRRSGGILGLSPDLAAHVRAAEIDMQSAEGLKRYLGRTLRDKRYDARVMRAISEGRGLSKADAELLASRYYDRLLSYRAERISRTEATAALNAGRNEGLKQLIESGNVRQDQVKTRWKSALDKRTRDSHFGMHNQLVKFGDPFQTPGGSLLMHPGDSSLGAPAKEIVNCRCTSQVEIDF